MAGTIPTSRSEPFDVAQGLWRGIYLVLAALFFALGMVGVLLPGLPTTPFLLLTSYFLMRSWPTLNQRMLQSRLIGPILRDWSEHRGVRPAIKLRAVLVVATVLALTAFFGNLPTPLLTGVLSLGAIGMAVIYYLPTIKPVADGQS